MSRIRYNSDKIKYELGFYKREVCSDEESEKCLKLIKAKFPLPENVAYEKNPDDPSTHEFIRYKKAEDENDEEFREYITLQQAKDIQTIKNELTEQSEYLKTIKKCAVFFTVITIIGMIFAAIAFVIPSFSA